MRLIAVPIARARPGVSPVSTFLAQRAPVPPSFVATRPALANDKQGTDTNGSAQNRQKGPVPPAPPPAEDAATSPAKGGKLPITSRIMNKAAEFWMSLGRENQKSFLDWKKRTYVTGERLMDRIEYEEWALKGVDPALGPSLTKPTKPREEGEASQTSVPKPMQTVALLYPPSMLCPTTLIRTLEQMTASRHPHHRQRLIWCVVGMPFTIPFALVPIIPNLPFFYLAWRAWSHWRAFQSSKYLNELLQQKRVVPSSSKELDDIFRLPKPPLTDAQKEEKIKSRAEAQAKDSAPSVDYESLMVLQPHHIKALAEEFKMEQQLSIDLKRARLQTIKSIKAGELSKLEAAATRPAEDDIDKQG